MPNSSMNFGGSGVNRTRARENPGDRVQAGSARQLPSLPWRRGQDSNLQGPFRNLTVFETAGPVDVPTPPWSLRVELNHHLFLMRETSCH